MSANMVEAIQAECNRVREVIRIYDELPNNVGIFGATWMRELVKRSEKAIAELDVVECVACLKELREVEP
jgi:hypothetical protein